MNGTSECSERVNATAPWVVREGRVREAWGYGAGSVNIGGRGGHGVTNGATGVVWTAHTPGWQDGNQPQCDKLFLGQVAPVRATAINWVSIQGQAPGTRPTTFTRSAGNEDDGHSRLLKPQGYLR